MKTLEGQLTAQGMKVAIVVARFNEFITSKLLSGAIDCENIEQAVERAGTKAGNKGVDAAMTAIEMVNLLKNI